MNTPLSFLLERFFTQRLMQQRQASPHTISSYRDTFRQFLKFTEQRLHKTPSGLNFQEIDAPLITAFLDHLEKHQGVRTRSRNLRLTALHSSFVLQLSWCRLIPPRSNGCLPSPASVLRAPWSPFSPVPKSMPCWRLRISALGMAGVIMPSCCWPYRPVCAYRR